MIHSISFSMVMTIQKGTVKIWILTVSGLISNVTRPFCLVKSHIGKMLLKRACSVLPHSHSVTTTSVVAL